MIWKSSQLVLRQDFIKLFKYLSLSSPEEFEKLEEVSPCLTICSEVGVSWFCCPGVGVHLAGDSLLCNSGSFRPGTAPTTGLLVWSPNWRESGTILEDESKSGFLPLLCHLMMLTLDNTCFVQRYHKEPFPMDTPSEMLVEAHNSAT